MYNKGQSYNHISKLICVYKHETDLGPDQILAISRALDGHNPLSFLNTARYEF